MSAHKQSTSGHGLRPNSRYGRQQKQPAMPVATVIYGDQKMAVINLDSRLSDV